MAFGLSPKHIEELPFDNLTTEQFLVLAIEAAKKLEWNVGYTSETGFIAFTKFSMSSWSEEVKVKIDGNNANLKSECTGSQMVDWGKNKKNIENLVSTFNELKNSIERGSPPCSPQTPIFNFGLTARPRSTAIFISCPTPSISSV